MKNLNKLLLSLAATAALASMTPAAQAATDTAGFNVTVDLTAVCEITAGPTEVLFTYSSFQPGDASSTGGDFSVRCTDQLPYSLSLDNPVGGQVVLGLTYTLSLSATTATGSGVAQNYTMTGTMLSGQSGTCATSPDVSACSGSQARLLTITY